MNTDNNTRILGNATLTRNASVGGNLLAGGNITVKGQLRVEGWMDAPNVKTPCKGLFVTAAALEEAYPTARPGWWALVGSGLPAEVYRAQGCRWEATGETAGEINVDLNTYDNLIDQVSDRISQVKDSIENIQHPISVKDCDSDLILADEEENPIATFADGHIRTANFDSATVMKPDDLPWRVKDTTLADLILADDDENPIAAFVDGHIRTANFNSANISGAGVDVKPYEGKWLSIVGDSISTYAGYNPTGYATYYPQGDVQRVQQTWWHQVAEATGMELLSNCAWSGSTTCGNSADSSGVVGCGNGRVGHLGQGEIAPDVVLIMMGINDFNTNKGVGQWDSHDALPEGGNVATFSEAYALLLCKIRQAYPRAEIMCCTLLDMHTGSGSWPQLNALNESVDQYNRTIIEVARIMGARVIDTHSCGISYFNSGEYLIDGVHPNAAGAQLLAKTVTNALNN